MKVGGQEVAENGCGASESVVSARSGDGPCRQIKIEKANGSSSGKKSDDLAVCFHGSMSLKWKKSSLPKPLRLGQKEFG